MVKKIGWPPPIETKRAVALRLEDGDLGAPFVAPRLRLDLIAVELQAAGVLAAGVGEP